jgi:uncharacterized membrane protein
MIMAILQTVGPAGAPMPTEHAANDHDIPVRRISGHDLNASLREGFADFASKRGDLVFIGLIYPVVGFLVSMAAMNMSVWPMVFPLIAGISLLGPLVATGFYELAKRRESGTDSNWFHFLDVLKSPSREEIAIIGAVLIGIFALWLAAAGLVHAAFFGNMIRQPSFNHFIQQVLTTPQGWGMIIVGNLVGLCFAVVVLALSVVSLPMLVDRQVSAGTAIRTSLRAFGQNKAVMLRWGLTVAVLLVLGSIPFFVGLAVVLPVLGYATWHLYTRLIDRSALPSS